MEWLGDMVTGMLVAACWLRYAVAPRFGDNFASQTSLAAFEISHQLMTGSENDRLSRMLVPIMVPLALHPSGVWWIDP